MSIELMDRLRDVIDVALDEWQRDYETESEESTYVAAAIVHDLGLEIRRDNLSGNGYRVIGKFIED